MPSSYARITPGKKHIVRLGEFIQNIKWLPSMMVKAKVVYNQMPFEERLVVSENLTLGEMNTSAM